MAEKQSFGWYSSIIDIVDEDTIIERCVISDDKLKQAIEKYGVDAVSSTGGMIIDYLYRMNKKQIDLVMSYKPNFIFRDLFNFDHFNNGHNYNVYILQKILEDDNDFKYAKCMIWCGQTQYANLECFVKIYYHSMTSVFRDPGILLTMCDAPHVNKHDVQKYILLSNHVKKWISLFDMMKRQLTEKRQF